MVVSRAPQCSPEQTSAAPQWRQPLGVRKVTLWGHQLHCREPVQPEEVEEGSSEQPEHETKSQNSVRPS